jgi:hypothetical protein
MARLNKAHVASRPTAEMPAGSLGGRSRGFLLPHEFAKRGAQGQCRRAGEFHCAGFAPNGKCRRRRQCHKRCAIRRSFSSGLNLFCSDT